MPVASITDPVTSLIGDYGLYAVFLLMLIDAVFPHPTLSETMHESVLAAYGRVLHV